MSAYSSEYLSTRLTIYAHRLIDFEHLVNFIELDLERLIVEVEALTDHYYQIDGMQADKIENQLS